MGVQMRPATAVTTALIATAALGLAGCGSSSSTGSSSSSTGSSSGAFLRLVMGAPLAAAPQFAPLAVAIDQGYWKKLGLNVSIKGLKGGTASVQALIADQADVSTEGPPSTLGAIASGHPLGTLSFYTWISKPEFSIAVPADSPIHSIQDLKGETIGVVDLGETDALAAKTIISSVLGVSPNEVHAVPIGTGAQAEIALKANRVAAYAAGDQGTAALNGIGYPMRELPLPTEAGKTTNTSFATTKQFYDTKAGQAELIAFGKGLSEATVFCKANIDACIKIFWKEFPTAAPANATSDFAKASQQIRAILEMRLPKYYADDGKWGYQSIEGLMSNASVLDLKVTTAQAQSLYTNSLVPAMSDFDEAKIVAAAKAYKD